MEYYAGIDVSLELSSVCVYRPRFLGHRIEAYAAMAAG